MVRWVKWAWLALVAQTAYAGGLLDPFPSYARLCGFPIIAVPTPNGAAAFIDPLGTPRILLDPRLLTTADSAERVFLLAHECGHHRLNHASREGLISRAQALRVVADQELSADCWAAETLARDGLMADVRKMADRFYRLGPVSPGQGYPSGVQRSLILRQCGEAGLAPPLPRPAASP